VIFSHLHFLCRYSERHPLPLCAAYIRHDITAVVLNCLDQSAPLDLVARVLYFITVVCRRDCAIARDFTGHVAIEKVVAVLQFLPESHFFTCFECLFQISCVCHSARASVFRSASFDRISRFATLQNVPGALSFWRFFRRMCSCQFAAAEPGAFLMRCIASSWGNCEPAVQIEMLGVISALCGVVKSWGELLIDLKLELFISSGLLNADKKLVTASMVCFAKMIRFLRPLDSHLIGLVELLKREQFLDVASFGILEVVRGYRDAVAFFL
jgi:hypothetical protein